MKPLTSLSSSAGPVTDLERLFVITRDVLGAASLDDALTSLARGVQELFGWRYVTMVAAEEPGGELFRRVMLGYPAEAVAQRLNEQIDRDAFNEMLGQAVRFFEDCYFFPAERELHWARSIQTGGSSNGTLRRYPSQWHERDALVLTLHDNDGVMIGYMSPDEPMSGEIPSAQVLRAMQVFVNLMGMALANARSQSRLQYEATHDSLTGLPNRTVFSLQLARALEAVHRTDGVRHAVLYLDLDEFKSINDTMGHLTGDDVLKESAQRLRAVVREPGVVSRMAGDEFAILLTDASRKHIDASLQAVHEALRRPYVVGARSFFITASIGVAQVHERYRSIADVLRDADTAMYHAKATGRDRSAFFMESMREEALRRLALRTDLRTAIEQHQFVVLYQPIVSIASGRIERLEALLRWNHPAQGYLAPAAFLPLAEEMGLLVPVGRFVLESACSEMVQWACAVAPRDLALHVNLSVQEVLQPDLREFLAGLVRRHSIQPGQLTLEITETSILQAEQRAAGVLADIKKLGIEICIDDFGTGYSSLRYIQSLPIDAFKIDQTFISNLSDPKSVQIIRMLIELGRSCGLRVTAEGIERAEQAERLLAFGCTSGQGFYFSHALSAAEISACLYAEEREADQKA